MKLMVLDGNSIINRAFYGVRMLNTKDGTPTNAVFGFLNILQKLRTEGNPDALCVTFDTKAPTFRKTQYEAYKAQRKGMPEELAVQMPILKDVLDKLRIPRYELEGYEADDLIGTIAAKCEAAGWECEIVTGDKDSFQLITGGTRVRHIKTRMGQTETTLYDPEAFRAEYGFDPIYMIDLKALMGDSSDNIPGVPGIGEKTALDLLHRFGSLPGVYGHLDDAAIKPAAKKKLEEGRASAEMSYDLATIRRDAPIDFDPEANRTAEPDRDGLYTLFRSLEFHQFIDRYALTPPRGEAHETVAVELDSREIPDAAALERALSELAGASCAAVYADDALTNLALAAGGSIWTLREDAYSGGWPEALRAVFSAPLQKAGHNVKNLMRSLLDRDLPVDGWVSDTALAAYLLDPSASDYDLAELASFYCGFRLEEADADPQLSLLPETEDRSAGMRRAEAVRLLCAELEKRLAEQGMDRLYREIELPLCPVLAEMEHTGFLVDRQAIIAFGETLAKGIDALQAEIFDLAGCEFNIGSPKQLGEVLFDKLLLPAPKKTKTGYSTNIDVLEKLRMKHPIIDRIIEYRRLTKLKSTYTDGLQRFIAPDGRIHTTFQMTVTATGRLSSTDPNLQNIPVRSELGGELRKMFVAGPGNVLVDADYSQIELRLLAHISGDETMRSAFRTGEDIHRITASQVFDVPPEAVTAFQRSSAKAVNFGIVYGISQFSLAQDIGVSVAEAKRYMDNYLAKYHGVRDYMRDVVEQAKADGYVTTLYGRRRTLPELASSNYNIRAFGERVALNAPIQGTAADLMKLAMIRVDRALKASGLAAKLLLQVHDELIVECPEAEAEQVKTLLCREMEITDLEVPLTAEAGVGKNWYDAK